MTGHYKGAEIWNGRGNPKYDAAIHCQKIIEVFESGEGVAEFCASSDISLKTFHAWTHQHPEFREHYDIAMIKGQAVWERKPIELAAQGITISHQFWLAIMRNRHKFSQSKMKVEAEDTTTSRMKAATESLQEGSITPQEFNQIASGLSTESRIKEVDLQKEMVDNVKNSCTISKEMKDEALKAFMLVMSGKGKVVDNESIRSSE